MKFVSRELTDTADISRSRRSWKDNLKTALGFCAILVLCYFLLGLFADLVATHLSEEWEARLFSFTEPIVDSGGREEGEAFARAESIFKRLSKSPDLRPLPYRLYLIDLDAPNAFALGGGSVVVTRGLLEKLTSEIGLATVLAHELGHHQHRHVLKRLGRTILMRVAVSLVVESSSGMEDSITNASLGLSESRYSRNQELEADTFALRLVHETYGRTDGCLEFFEKIQEEHGSVDSPWLELFSSHPLTADRIEEMRALQKELERPKKTDPG